MNSNKTGILTMARKAGKVAMGMDMVKKSCGDGSAATVLVTTDISPKSLKEARFSCTKSAVKLFRIDMTMDEMADTLGKRAGVIAITDGGFARSCTKGLEEIALEKDEFDM